MKRIVPPAAVVILKVRELGQLVPADLPLLNGNRFLKADVETFIMEQAEAIPRNSPVRIIIHTLEDPGSPMTAEVVAAIHKHFSYRNTREKYHLGQTLRAGWNSLMLGILFLVLMYSLANYFIPLLPPGSIMITIREMFIILGWVALWRPAELLLYDWIPLRRKSRMFERLATCEVEIRSGMITD